MLLLVAGMVIGGSASATLIDFEDLPNSNTIVTDQYRDLGVLFSLIDSPYPSPFIPPQRPRSNIIAPTVDFLGGGFDYDIQIDFSRPAFFASLNVLDAEEAFTVRAYLAGSYVATATIQSLGRGPGGPEYLATVTGATFDRLIVDLTNEAGSGAGGPEAYDDLNFELTAVQIPEPATLALVALGLAGLSFSRRRSASWRYFPHSRRQSLAAPSRQWPCVRADGSDRRVGLLLPPGPGEQPHQRIEEHSHRR